MKKNILAIIIILYVFKMNVVAQETCINNWNDLYNNFIEELNQEYDFSTFKIAIIDIDKDFIPELITESYMINKYDENDISDTIKIYTIENNSVKEIYSQKSNHVSCFISNNPDYKEFYLLEKTDYINAGVDNYIALKKDNNEVARNENIAKLLSEYDETHSLPESYPYDFKNNFYYMGKEVGEDEFLNFMRIGTPITFTDYEDKENLSKVLNYNYPYSYDFNEIELYPQLSSPVITIDFQLLKYDNGIYDIVPYEYNFENNDFENAVYKFAKRAGSNSENLNLLMINGVFVENPNIIIENEIFYIPLRLVSEKTGKTVVWNNIDKTVDINGLNLTIKMDTVNKIALINNDIINLENFLKINNDCIYLSLEFFSKHFNLDVNVNFKLLNTLNAISIENKYDFDIYEVDEAKKNLISNFKQLETDDEIFKIDMNNIEYTGNLGRYYLFNINKEDVYWRFILVNKYSGEVFTHKSGIKKGLGEGQQFRVINGEKYTIVG